MSSIQSSSLSGRVISLSQLKTFLALRRKRRTRVVFTNGVFDILHAGHIRYLTKARTLGDLLIVGMNSDSSVQRLKGPARPIQSQKDRALILTSLRAVDAVVLFSDDTPLKLIKSIRPDVLVKGADYKLSDIVGRDFVTSYGGTVKRIPFVVGRSSTRIVQALTGRKQN